MAGHTLRHSNTSPLVMLNASFAAWGERSPDHHVRDEICIGGFPDEGRTAWKAERFTLLAADCRVDTDSRDNVQRTGGRTGDKLWA
ncbi:hypothetical protein ABIF20_004713 [Bradyrhizobium japonicum]